MLGGIGDKRLVVRVEQFQFGLDDHLWVEFSLRIKVALTVWAWQAIEENLEVMLSTRLFVDEVDMVDVCPPVDIVVLVPAFASLPHLG